jgi:predicted metalloprotease with PDZ domain
MVCGRRSALVLSFIMGLASPGLAHAAQVASALIDLSHAQQGRFHAELDFPTKPGPVVLAYPRWIPGDHAPAGPIENLAGLSVSANGRPLAWRRDPFALDRFRVRVPKGATHLHVSLDFLATRSVVTAVNQASAATSDSLAILRWHTVLLYPLGVAKQTYLIQPNVILPAGWTAATALPRSAALSPPLQGTGSTLAFRPVPLETLIDSPLLAGRQLKTYPIASDLGAPVSFDIAADDPADLALTTAQLESLSRLADEAHALFGSTPFARYDFLVNISAKIRARRVLGGQEHGASCDCIGGPGVFSHPEARETVGDSLAHEFAHAWNGKYRRPAGEVVKDFQTPYDDDLLWVYEGLTYYFGHVLATRAGFWSQQDFRDAWAETAAEVDNRPGRNWKSLQDTARSLPTLMHAPNAWTSWRRSVDYYPEGGMLWLAVDMQIRRLTSDKRSLDDFCRLFFAKEPNSPIIRAYDLSEIVATLDKVAPYSWHDFIEARLDLNPPDPDLSLAAGGWRVSYDASPSAFMQAQEIDGSVNASYSAGLSVDDKGDVADVIWNSAAFEAGLAPGMRILAIEERPYSAKEFRAALDRRTPMHLRIDNGGLQRTILLDYRGGQRYPHLQRIDGTTDRLSAIGAARTSAPAGKADAALGD